MVVHPVRQMLQLPLPSLVSKMPVVDTVDKLDLIIREDGRYPRSAYEFLFAGLSFTVRQAHGKIADDQPHHVSGQALCHGLRDLAISRWGAMALTVLYSWNIRSTRDFGEMVFLLIEHELMGKQDSDRIEDFDEVYDFNQEFGHYELDVNAFDE